MALHKSGVIMVTGQSRMGHRDHIQVDSLAEGMATFILHILPIPARKYLYGVF